MLRGIWSPWLWLCHIGGVLSSWLGWQPLAPMDPRVELERRLDALDAERPEWYALRFSQGRVYLVLLESVVELPFRPTQFAELLRDGLDQYGDFLAPWPALVRKVAESYDRNAPRYERTQALFDLRQRRADAENARVLDLLGRMLRGMRADAQEDDFPSVNVLDPSLLLIATEKRAPLLAAELLVAGIDPAQPFERIPGVKTTTTTALEDLETDLRLTTDEADRQVLLFLEEAYRQAASRLRGGATKSARKTSAQYVGMALAYAKGNHKAAARLLYVL